MENKIKLLNTSSSTYFANNRLDIGSSIPTSGDYNMGDIIIKSTQVDGEPIGWICIESGNPGVWNEFGGTIKIENPFTLEPGCIGNNELANEVKLKLLEIENKGNVNNTKISQVQNSVTQLESNVNSQLEQLQTDVENNMNPKINTNTNKINANTAKIGDLNKLNTKNKTDLVNAINEVFQRGNNVKQNLVDALIAKKVECSTSDSFETLINLISTINTNPYPSWSNDFHNTWLTTGTATNLSSTRTYLMGAVVDKKFYILGGFTGSISNPSTVVDCYDVENNTMTLKTKLPLGIYSSACSVVDGKIYIIGGYSQAYKDTNFCYDPSNGSCIEKSTMPTIRRYCGSAAIDKKIYVIGGINGSTYIKANECYDTLTDSWTTKTDMPVAKQGLSVATINNIIYATGGYTGSVVKTHYAYDVNTDTWSTKATLPATRVHGAMVVNDGKLYYLGGCNNSTTYYKTNYQYDPSTNTWTTMATLPATKQSFAAGSIDNKIIISGGYNGSYLSTTDIYLV